MSDQPSSPAASSEVAAPYGTGAQAAPRCAETAEQLAPPRGPARRHPVVAGAPHYGHDGAGVPREHRVGGGPGGRLSGHAGARGR